MTEISFRVKMRWTDDVGKRHYKSTKWYDDSDLAWEEADAFNPPNMMDKRSCLSFRRIEK